VAPPDSGTRLGTELRKLREKARVSLREIERRTGINSGYLSQLERGEVQQPTPSMIQRLAQGYEVPLALVMQWAGYELPERKLTPAQERALHYLGPDPSEEDVETLGALLEVIRKRSGAAFSAPHPLDRPLDAEEIRVIRDYALALLREADALGDIPTPLDQLTGVAKLVYAGEIELTPEERRHLLRRCGDRLHHVMQNLKGMITFRSREIWLAPDLYAQRRRFVHAHELGHHVLPAHKEIAYLDNWESLSPTVRDACEREANQAAIELLAQGDQLREEADSSRIDKLALETLSAKYDISLQATTRRVAEESRQSCCVITYYRGSVTGKLMDPHVYPSQAFEERFRWKAGRMPDADLRVTLREAALASAERRLICRDIAERAVDLRCEAFSTPRALIGLVVADPERRSVPTRLFVRR
jgi:transcriptional regulator with XRE-family HTH domain